MSIPDSKITPQILKAAEEEFARKGFVNTSLREICQKAGVTTGALYKRFGGKDVLFTAVLKPTLDDIFCAVRKVEDINAQHLKNNITHVLCKMTEETLKEIINFIYDRYNGFHILLCESEGSEYSNFLHDFVTDQTKRTMNFVEKSKESGLRCQIDEVELHMLLTAFWTVVLEPVLHGLPREEALKRCKTIAKFFNWEAVFCF